RVHARGRGWRSERRALAVPATFPASDEVRGMGLAAPRRTGEVHAAAIWAWHLPLLVCLFLLFFYGLKIPFQLIHLGFYLSVFLAFLVRKFELSPQTSVPTQQTIEFLRLIFQVIDVRLIEAVRNWFERNTRRRLLFRTVLLAIFESVCCFLNFLIYFV